MEINVCFGLNDEYCEHCACTMASVLVNSNPNDKYIFYLISDYISDDNKKSLESMKSIRDFDINFLKIETDEFQNLNVNNDIGLSAFFRFKAFEMLDVKKFIYLDCDIIVRKNIAELYNTNIDGYYCAGVEDLLNPVIKEYYGIDSKSLYINSGVMLINLELCKKDNIYNHIMEFLGATWDKAWGDQDIINKIFENKILGVDIKWNNMYPYDNYYEDKEYYEEISQDPAIKHYITGTKPWIQGKYPHMKMEYYNYLRYTPWSKNIMGMF